MTLRVLLWNPDDDYLADLLGSFPALDHARIDSTADLAAALPSTDAIVMLGHFYTADVARLIRERGQRLRWIQLTTAGYDGILLHGVPRGVVVTNAGQSYAPMAAEHAMMLLTALVRRLPAFAELQMQHEFDRAIPLPLATLEGSTVAILGYGSIGRETARRLKAFDATVLGIARTRREDKFADVIYPAPALHDVLGQADALVVTAALTPETSGMINVAALAALKPGAVLVNIARGGIIDTPALVNALRGGRLAGAGLDVTSPEPLPPGHPLWTCPNLIITPHVSGMGSPGVRRRIGALMRDNVERFLEGRELLHEVV